MVTGSLLLENTHTHTPAHMHTPEQDESERRERRLSVQDDMSQSDGRDKASNCSFRFRVNNPSADTPNRTLLIKIYFFHF